MNDIQLYAWQENVKIPIDIVSVNADNLTCLATAKDGYKLTTKYIDGNSWYYTRSKSAVVSLWEVLTADGDHVELVKKRIAEAFDSETVTFIHVNSLQHFETV